jgi:hypothetical protein
VSDAPRRTGKRRWTLDYNASMTDKDAVRPPESDSQLVEWGGIMPEGTIAR